MQISVLYIHPSGIFGGASRSLLELLRVFAGGDIKAHVLAQGGQVASILEEEGISVVTSSGITQFDNTFFGFYRGLRWLILLREFFYVFPSYRALRAARVKWAGIDIVHVNELTALPTAIIAKRLFGVPLVVHVRSVQRPMKDGLRGHFLEYLVNRYVDQLVAIDLTVRESLPKSLNVVVVHNGFPLPEVPRAKSDQSTSRTFSPQRPLRVGFVGGLLKLKGVYEFVEAARLCIQAGLAVEFLIAGENPRSLHGIRGYLLERLGFAVDVRAALEFLVDEYNLSDCVKMRGFTADVKEVYESIDVLCFPSYLNACGRPVFEAAFSRVPSIVAVNNPQEDTIIDGQTGICIPAKDPKAIAEAVTFFYSNPDELEHMGEAAYQLARKNFDIALNAQKMVDIYRRLLKEGTSQEVNA